MSDHNNYHRGSIISVHMVNFMTFADVTFYASPKLNIILGQNGSGKSTITCAVCLALAEDPKLLLRGTRLDEFIKYGESRAIVDLCLRGDRKDIVITLVIHRSAGASYFMNKKESSKQEVRELRKLLGIDLSNLCQFLPQDRVADFVNQNPQTRLREFEKSVGGSEFYMTHTQLIDYQQNQNGINTKITQKEQRIETEKQIMETLKREKDKAEARSEFIKRKKLITTHIQMIQYDMSLRRFSELRNELHEIKTKIKEEDEKNSSLKETIEAFKQSISHLQQLISDEERKMISIRGKVKKLMSETKELSKEYNREYKVYENIDKKQNELLNNLKKKQKEVEEITQQLENFEDPETTRQRITKLNEEISQLRDEKSHNTTELPSLQNQRRTLKRELDSTKRMIEKLTNKDSAKLKHLEEVDADTAKALVWLNENRGLFKMTVYGPIMNEISFSDDRACQWFENTISNDIMLTFVTQCTEDYDLFVREVREKLHYRISVTSVDDSIRLVPSLSNDQMTELKISGFFGDLMTCPDVVRRALFNNTSLKNIYFVNDNWKMPANYDNLIDVLDIDTGIIILSSSYQYRLKLSRYVNSVTHKKEVSLQVSSLRACKIMTNDDIVDKEEVERLNSTLHTLTDDIAKVNDQIVELEKKSASFDKKIHKKEAERSGIEEQKKKRTILQNQQRRLKQAVHEIEEELSQDFEQAKQQQKAKLQSFLSKQSDLLTKRKPFLLELLQLTICKESFLKVCNTQETNLKQYEQQFAEFSRTKRILEAQRQTVEQERDRVKNEIREMKVMIYQQSGLFKCPIHEDSKNCTQNCKQESTPLFDEVKKMNFPTDIDVCRAEVRVIDDKIREIHVNDAAILEYEEREVTVKTLERELQALKEEAHSLVTTMEMKERSFKEQLTRLVDKLNTNFILFMTNIQCKGRVVLENAENFRQIGLDVQVSFREDQELQSLNGQVQSGGEKSLSTVLYLLSLQEMVSFPFRFIDEINQNMDKRNERYVMQQLLAKGRQKAAVPQTFVITPKLLSDFPFDDQVTFHIIFQGQYLPSGFCWNSLAAAYNTQRKRQHEENEEDEENEENEEDRKRKEVECVE